MSVLRSHPPHTGARLHQTGLIASAATAVALTICSVTVVAWASPSAGTNHSALAADRTTTSTDDTAARQAAQQIAQAHQLALARQAQQEAAQQAAAQAQQNQQAQKFFNTLIWNRNVAYEKAVAHAQTVRAAQLAANQAAARAAQAAAAQAAQPTALAAVAASTPAPAATMPPSVAATFACIREHESHGDYSAVNPRSGAGGAYQFIPSTWASLGGTGLPENAPPAVQDAMATKLWQRDGFSPWRGDGCVG